MFLYRRPTENGFPFWEKEGSPIYEVTQAADRAFPGIAEQTEKYAKLHGPTALAKELQRRESEVFIDIVLPQLHELGLYAVPIHDGYICLAREVEAVQALLSKELESYTKIRPRLKP